MKNEWYYFWGGVSVGVAIVGIIISLILIIKDIII